MNRVDRLAAIVIQLQTRRLIKAQQLADKFGISLRTVYRDIKALEEAGVPIIGEAGMGYQLMEGYKLPPVMFTEDEATALLTGAKIMQIMSDDKLLSHYSSALDKIRAVLRLSEKDYLETIDDHIAVVRRPSFAHEPPSDKHFSNLLKAISGTHLIEINYFSFEKNEINTRQVEPVGVFYGGSHWYLIAFCRLRNDYRNFRTDRIQKLIIKEETITASHPPLQHFINQTANKRQLQKIVIDVDRNIIKYFGEQKYYSGFVKEECIGDVVRMTFLCDSLTGFAKWFLLFGNKATIIEPQSLSDLVISMAEEVIENVRKSAALLT